RRRLLRPGRALPCAPWGAWAGPASWPRRRRPSPSARTGAAAPSLSATMRRGQSDVPSAPRATHHGLTGPPNGAVSGTSSVYRLGRRRLGLAPGPRLGGEQDAHPPPVHRRRSLPLAHVRQLPQARVEAPPAFLLVLHLPSAEEDVDQHLVVVLQELPRLVHLGFDVMLARLGADADLL